MINVLLVGAGVVGRLVGDIFQEGGAEIGFLSRSPVPEPVVVQRLTRKGSTVEHILETKNVFTNPGDAAKRQWDVVVLSVATDVLRSNLLTELSAQVIGDATVLTFALGLDDRSVLEQHIPADQLVYVTIPHLAFYDPMGSTSQNATSVSYWVPSNAKVMMFGSAERVRPVIEHFQRGNQRAVSVKTLGKLLMTPALVVPLVLALQTVDWKISRMEEVRSLAVRAGQEAMMITAAATCTKAPPALIANIVSHVVLPIAPRLLPFDLEMYLRVHFSKVARQNELMLQSLIDEGIKRSLSVVNLSRLQTLVSKEP